MRHVTLIRVLRWPLVVVLAINLATLTLTPMARWRSAQTLVSRPSAPIRPVQTPSTSATDPSSSKSATVLPDQPAEPTPDALFLEEDANEIAESEVAPTSEHDREPTDAPDTSVCEPPNTAWLFSVGAAVGEFQQQPPPVHRAVACLASHFTRWQLGAPAESKTTTASEGSIEAGSHVATDPTTALVGDVPPAAAPATETSTGSILITNPAENGYAVSFLLDGRTRSLPPGQELKVEAIEAEVRFHRGSEFGESRQSLQVGTYRFFLSNRGWILQPTL